MKSSPTILSMCLLMSKWRHVYGLLAVIIQFISFFWGQAIWKLRFHKVQGNILINIPTQYCAFLYLVISMNSFKNYIQSLRTCHLSHVPQCNKMTNRQGKTHKKQIVSLQDSRSNLTKYSLYLNTQSIVCFCLSFFLLFRLIGFFQVIIQC